MKVYVAHSFKHRHEQKELLDAIENCIKACGMTPFFFTRAYKDFGTGHEKEMMTAALSELGSSDILIAELSTKEVGVGLEIGYAAGKGLPIVYVHHEDSDYSTTVAGTATAECTYKNANDISGRLTPLLATFIANR